jgi:hypothetical protein
VSGSPWVRIDIEASAEAGRQLQEAHGKLLMESVRMQRDLARITAERDEAIAALDRLRVVAEALVPRRIPTTLMNDRDRDLAHALDATPTDLAASQRREWRASGMEAAAERLEKQRANLVSCHGDAWTRDEVEDQIVDALDDIRDMAKRERGA